MRQKGKDKRMTMDTLARMTQAEFDSTRKEVAEQFGAIRRVMGTKEDLNAIKQVMATKEDLKDFKDVVVNAIRQDNLKVLESNDKLMSKIDVLFKEDMAHTASHKKLDDKLLEHEDRLKKLEGFTK
jgi:hypothetical protein